MNENPLIYLKNKSTNLFLLYVSVMLIITFLQQEFILLPELQAIDIVEEDTKAQLLEKWQKIRWLSYLSAPIILLLRLFLVTMCLYIGGFFDENMTIRNFKEWWNVAMISQSIMILYSVTLLVMNICYGSETSLYVTEYTSLLFLGKDNMEQWLKLPLAAVNIFEIAYWCIMSLLIMRMTTNKFGSSFKYVMSTYGVGYLFYIIFMMFLILYLV